MGKTERFVTKKLGVVVSQDVWFNFAFFGLLSCMFSCFPKDHTPPVIL